MILCLFFQPIQPGAKNFLKPGTDNFGLQSVRRHQQFHQKLEGRGKRLTVQEGEGDDMTLVTRPPIAIISKLSKASREGVIALFNNMYFIAKTGAPLSQLASLNELAKANHSTTLATHENWRCCNLLRHIACM